MEERELRHWIDRVKDGTITRRNFTRMMVGVGLTAPLAAQMLAAAGVAHAQTKPAFAPTKRGGGGTVKVLWWQSPTLLNPHFANGTKDQDGSRIFYEPLASFDPDGNLFPNLAAEVPTVQNGGVAKDGTSVTWKLKRNVQWHDGKPFTADDVVFNWEYATDPATAAVTAGAFPNVVKVEKVDALTVKVTFNRPQPFPYTALCGPTGQIIPKHVFEAFKGANSREAPANVKPVGTGAYRYVDFKPGDMVRAELNPNYHVPNRPFFDTIELKGGGDAASAARAVIQTGEYDYAWNMQVEDDILKRLEQGGKGRINISLAGDIEHIQLNNTDPWTEVDGERSSVKSKHPFLTDPAVRQALSLLVDRGSVQEQLYGRQGQATANFLNAPSKFSSKNNKWELNPDKAGQILEAAGWKKGAGRHPREGRQEAEDGLPDLDQRRPPEDAGHREAGRGEGGHRDRAEVGGGVGVLRLRPGQLGYVSPLRDRPPDVHDHDDPSRSPAAHGPVHLVGGGVQGEQVAGAQSHAVAQRGVRQALEVGRCGDGSRQARGHVHPDERPPDPERGRDSGHLAREGLRALAQAEGHRHQRLGFGPREPGLLEPRSVVRLGGLASPEWRGQAPGASR